MRDLVERAMHGDREAFGWLVNQTADRMYAIATRILRDTHLAEDAVQGALITAWRQLPTLRDPDRFEPWVRKLVIHACYAEARRHANRGEPQLPVGLPTHASRSADQGAGGPRGSPAPARPSPRPVGGARPKVRRGRDLRSCGSIRR